ncbi:MAG: DNA-protecting protein DprA [Chitinophagaceae bacterium]|nr:MAG: DNA-protecting protein DprA [Chitinophagaceae bacterium]
MHPDLLYQIALTMIPSIGPVQARLLLDHMEARDVFRSSTSTLEKIEGIGSIRAGQIRSFHDYSAAEKEIKFIDRYRIRPLFIRDADYPQRLLNCFDAPTLLYFKGTANLNHPKIISVIGTRSNTIYGKQVTEKLVSDLSGRDVMVISGLAFGIDGIAHRSAIRHGMPTVGVLAHGLDQVYPPAHQALAREMVAKNGGLLTEFNSHSKPERFNFPLRNRIVAGMADAVVVAETNLRGGSMITAELANGYNREVFVFPGRINDPKSAGCNKLLQQNKAVLLQETTDLLELMNWDEPPASKRVMVTEDQPLDGDEQLLFDILKDGQAWPLDAIFRHTGLDTGRMASSILGLELKNLLLSLPGKLYRLNGS